MKIKQSLFHTQKKILKEAGCEDYEASIKLLFSKAFRISLNESYRFHELRETDENLNLFLNYVSRRAAGEPTSHIICKRSFWQNDFYVDRTVLDPRPEREILVDVAKKILKKNKSTTHILELGVGSGCVIISIMQELREFRIKGTGVDISESSLKVAKKNQKKFKIVNLHLFRSNWFSNLTNKYDMIVSNPPYLKTSDIKFLDDEVKKYDPLVSLDGGKNGLNAYKEIASNVKKYLAIDPKGAAVEDNVICLIAILKALEDQDLVSSNRESLVALQKSEGLPKRLMFMFMDLFKPKKK